MPTDPIELCDECEKAFREWLKTKDGIGEMFEAVLRNIATSIRKRDNATDT